MPSQNLNLTAQIIMSHASMRELTPKELIMAIKRLYAALVSLETEDVPKPSIPLKDIVKAKYIICLECGKKLKTLKTHLRKTHKLTPKEYFQQHNLDPKKFPLVCKDYSAARSQMAKNRGFGIKGTHHKVTS